ncbi:MAG: LPS-assembly protein LptD [Rhodomicrobium sp.]
MLSRFAIALLTSLGCLIGTADAQQTGGQQARPGETTIAKQVSPNKSAPLLLQADDLIYDNRNNRVIARGNVEAYQDDNVLLANELIYDKTANTLTAIGNVRLKEADGSVVNAERLTLTSNFRDGFVRSMQALTQDDTRIAAANAFRKDTKTVYEKTVVTSCKPCEEHPERPPIWRIKATRVIQDKEDHNIYYENAQFEFYGIPIAWVPYFYTADNTVQQRSGFLTPTYSYNSSTLGYAVAIPYYWGISPNYDLLLTPEFTTQAGYLMQAWWRQRLWNGAYEVKLAGAYNNNAQDFTNTSQGFFGDREWRGSVETKGDFEINRYWHVGWNAIVESDDTFRRFYNLDSIYATERVSTLYLTGIGDRSYFNLSFNRYGNLLGDTYDFSTGTYLKSVTATSYPSIDYNYIHNKPVLGGELSFDVNALALQINDPANLVSPVTRGVTDHIATDMQWRRTLKDDFGEVFTPFVFARADVYNVSSFTDITGNSGAADTLTRQLAGIGLDYRYPFVANTEGASHVIEPIAQIIARGGAAENNKIPNEDAQSLVFDDTLLFDINKFSGYDQVETGTRTNFGVQYTMQAYNGISIRTVAGESIQLAGTNPYALYYGSGLETDRSDYVAGTYFDYKNLFRLMAQFRWNEKDLSLSQQDYTAQLKLGFLQWGVGYEAVAAQPSLGFPQAREEVSTFGALKLTDEWTVFGDLRYDFQLGQFIRNSLGVQYADECFIYAITYQQTWVEIEDIKPNTSVMVRIGIKGFGQQTTPTSIYDISPEAAAYR